jgi:type II secretory pathway component PulK
MSARRDRGFALIFIMALCMGLVAVVLLYANTASLEYRGAGNAVASAQARQAAEGARRYLEQALANFEEPGFMPATGELFAERVPVGDAAFWILGRDPDDDRASEPWFGLVDEASKLDLNHATLEMIEAVPGMTLEFAAAIVDWRDEDSDLTPGGAESENYLLLDEPYQCKNAPFETVRELRLVYGADWDELVGEDANMNHLLDPNEDDGDALPPADNQDGLLDRGLFAYFTVHAIEPNTDPDGNPRVNINGNETDKLEAVLSERLGEKADSVLQILGGPGQRFSSMLEFFLGSGIDAEDFAAIEPYLTVSDDETLHGMVNVNTAPEEILACLPGIGPDLARDLVAERGQRPSQELRSVAWVAEVIDDTAASLAGPHLTARPARLSADVVATGANGRGFCRVRYVFDTSGDTVTVVARDDLSRGGWPLDESPRALAANDWSPR